MSGLYGETIRRASQAFILLMGHFNFLVALGSCARRSRTYDRFMRWELSCGHEAEAFEHDREVDPPRRPRMCQTCGQVRNVVGLAAGKRRSSSCTLNGITGGRRREQPGVVAE